jgi:hypothetical protein
LIQKHIVKNEESYKSSFALTATLLWSVNMVIASWNHIPYVGLAFGDGQLPV